MPTIAVFFGLIIKMYFQQREHNPPHVHVEFGEDAAAVGLSNGEVLDGYLPLRAQRLARKWVELHQSELLEMWNTQIFRKFPPLT